MANTVEVAIRAVANHPHVGRVAEGVYVGRQLANNRIDQVISFTAVWGGAARLTGDKTAIGLFLDSNPNMGEYGGAPVLTIDRSSNGTGREVSNRQRIVFRQEELSVLDPKQREFVETVLENITKELV